MNNSIASAFEDLLRRRLKAKLVAEGTSAADADKVLADVSGAHPLLELFMTYGLPFILQLLSNLLAMVEPTPAPTNPE